MKRLIQKAVSLTVTLCILFSMCTVVHASKAEETEGINELKGHWAEETLTEWVRLGLLKGDNKGNYNPNSKITRAEFMALVNRVMNYTAKSDKVRGFSDISPNKWYYDDASKALGAGYINGTTATTLSPEETITREQAITIISRIKGIDQGSDAGNGSGIDQESAMSSDTGILSLASDSSTISSWARGPIAGAIREGLVTGTNGRINPKADTTRCEAIVLLDRVRTDTRIYYFAGTYGPESGIATAGNVVIASPGIKLRNLIVNGDLEIADSVGDGQATLDNVVVQGKLVAKGGKPTIIAAADDGDGDGDTLDGDISDGGSGGSGGDGSSGGGTPSGGKGDGDSGGGGSGGSGGGSSGGSSGGGKDDDKDDGKDDDTPGDKEPVLTAIAITNQPSKLTYVVGEALDITGLVVIGTYSDKKTKTEKVTINNISGFNSATAGQKTVTITVSGKKATLTVSVMPPVITPGDAYYIDYEAGDDANSGTSMDSPWKHCPGDKNAAGIAASTELKPGDAVLFRGDVIYRGTISARSDGVNYRGDAWPTGSKAIIDGSDLYLSEKAPCAKDECGSNPNWENIVSIDLPETATAHNFMMFDETEKLWLAQFPKVPDPFWEDDFKNYRAVSSENITVSSITDPEFFNQEDPHYWDGAYIMIWINPNSVTTQPVTGYDPDTGTIYYKELSANAIYGDRDQYFSMANHIDLVTQPGEYCVDEANHKMYLWPRDNSDLSLVSREWGFDIIGGSDIIIEGFVIERLAGGAAIITRGAWMGSGLRSNRITIRNNEMRWIRKTGVIGTGAITLRNGDGNVIENNYIHDNQREQGIIVTESSNVLIRNNTITRSGYKGIWFMDVENAQIIGNRFFDNKATHGTDTSIFTSKNVLFADNIAFNSQTEMLSFENDENIFIYNNILLGNGGGAGVVRQNGDNMKGILFIAHNMVLYSGSNIGLNCAASRYPDARYIVKNNILDGWTCVVKEDGQNVNKAVAYEVSHNIYTSLAWIQASQYGWYLMPGEKVEKDLNLIFRNPVEENAPVIVPVDEMPGIYMLKENSPAIASGEKLNSVIPEEAFQLFPDYDFYKDIEGNPRPADKNVDIGAYNASDYE